MRRGWAAALGAMVLAVSACSPQLPKAPPPPTTTPETTTTATTTVPATTALAGGSPAKSTTTALSAAGSAATTTTAGVTTTGPPPPADVAYNTNAVATYAVGLQPSNWNIHSASAAPWYSTLSQVLDQVWPSVFEVGPSGVPVLDTALVSSAQLVSPTSVVYQLNPKAVWSDGVPITYKDFVYNWRAQAGAGTWRDAGGRRFRPMDPAGYDDIASVAEGAGGPSTVTVTFSHPYPYWQSLFAYLMPAHVGEAIGFDTGFSDPVTDLVSGGPYMVADVEPGYSLELVRNARYWAGAGDLAAITYYFTTGAPQTFDALSTGELDVASLQVPASSFGQLQSTAGLSADVVASSQYEDLDFNEKAGPLRSAVLREAVMMAVDRAAMATAVLGPYGLAAKPVDNRVLLAGSPGYVPEGAAYDEPRPAEALQLLAAHGYTRHSEGLVGPKGIPVHLSLYVSSADLVAQDLAAKVVSSCAGIGISVSVVPGTVAAGDVAGTERAVAPPTGWEMAIELRQIPTFPSGIGSTYATGGQADVDGYSSGSMNLLLARASRAPGTELPAVYDKLDALAWKDAVDLPLVAVPVIVALDTQLLNVQPGPWPDAIAWNEEDWGFAAP